MSEWDKISGETKKRLDYLIDSDSMLSPIKKFVEFHGAREEYGKWDVREFLKNLEEKGMSKNFKRFSYHCLRNLFEAMDLEWDLNPRKDLPKKPSSEESRTPMMGRDEVEDMVSAAINKGYRYEEFYTCLSTCYGLRRKELHEVRPEDLKFKEDRNDGKDFDSIFIRTAKGGEKREQWMPPEIKPILKGYEFNEDIPKRDISVMNRLFDRIIEKANIPKRDGLGFHSIRRSLRTNFGRKLREVREEGGAGLVESDIFGFMRWKSKTGEQEMLSIYNKASAIEGDKEVFKIHPFLQMWK